MQIEHVTRNHFGTDHTYIVKPVELAELWARITGRKTITQRDLDHLHELAQIEVRRRSHDRTREALS